MLFHEIYGSYFQTVARILREAGKSVTSGISEKRMMEIIAENAFAESTLVIPEKLKSGEWPLLKMEDKTPGASSARTGAPSASSASSVLASPPTRPLTLLEKQWLRALVSDPRLRLFLEPEEDQEKNLLAWLDELLKDVPPLWEKDTFEYYDRYSDGDPYTDPDYIDRFHTILRAIREKRLIYLRYTGRHGTAKGQRYFPYALEYSAKDDKFRLHCRSRKGTPYTVNLGRISTCELRRPAEPEEMHGRKQPAEVSHVDMILTDERNALQRAMLHFSDLKKETERIDEKHYRIRLYYNGDDETEILIRILSYGPMLQVTAPESFIGLIRERIGKQENIKDCCFSGGVMETYL